MVFAFWLNSILIFSGTPIHFKSGLEERWKNDVCYFIAILVTIVLMRHYSDHSIASTKSDARRSSLSNHLTHRNKMNMNNGGLIWNNHLRNWRVSIIGSYTLMKLFLQPKQYGGKNILQTESLFALSSAWLTNLYMRSYFLYRKRKALSIIKFLRSLWIKLSFAITYWTSDDQISLKKSQFSWTTLQLTKLY